MKSTAKKMSVFQLTTLVAANMLGAGIIMLPTKLAEVGTISVLSWLITAVGALILAHIFAQCGMFTTRSGGMGGYSEYAFGRTGHFMANYSYAISLVIANVAIAISAVGYTAVLFNWSLSPVQLSLATIALLWLAALLNFGGNARTGKISNITVWGSIIPVLFVSTFGWFWFDPELYKTVWNPNQMPFFSAVSESITLTLWAFLGFESAAANMDAVENPKKNVPIATFFGTLAVAVIYVLSTNIMAGIVPNLDLLHSTAPFGLVFAHMFNETVGHLVMASMIIACCGAILCWQFTLSRVFKSAAEEGFFPKVFSRVNKADAPVRGLIILLLVQTALALMTTNENLSHQFENLVNLAVVTNVFPYILCCISVNTLLKEENASLFIRRSIAGLSFFALLYSVYAIYAAGEGPIIGGTIAIVMGYIGYQIVFNIIPKMAEIRKG
ncbi:putrescine-ornithine antiporter [uncultured Veillonella sp.]|uniref:putrescine-ornithine antiporter n=1 Tax=uncultured Veillonella sp. TaxID=159268 RepID=UPI0025FB0178|nr:putrescine-ornithine antiporter [uncultured Veillonella sp.]